MNKIQSNLNKLGVADTRRYMIESALEACHRAFAPLDDANRARIVQHLPFLAQCARYYGLNSVASNTFENEGIVMPDDAIKEILDNL